MRKKEKKKKKKKKKIILVLQSHHASFNNRPESEKWCSSTFRFISFSGKAELTAVTETSCFSFC